MLGNTSPLDKSRLQKQFYFSANYIFKIFPLGQTNRKFSPHFATLPSPINYTALSLKTQHTPFLSELGRYKLFRYQPYSMSLLITSIIILAPIVNPWINFAFSNAVHFVIVLSELLKYLFFLIIQSFPQFINVSNNMPEQFRIFTAIFEPLFPRRHSRAYRFVWCI